MIILVYDSDGDVVLVAKVLMIAVVLTVGHCVMPLSVTFRNTADNIQGRQTFTTLDKTS